jgi:uroporphyrinogen decarboxylase
LKYVLDAIKMTKEGLADRVPLIGFAGAPFTIFCYMTEGKGSKTFSVAKKHLYADPNSLIYYLQKITDSTIAYLKAQIVAGADLVQLFRLLGRDFVSRTVSVFSLPYIKQICDAITEVRSLFLQKAHSSPARKLAS